MNAMGLCLLSSSGTILKAYAGVAAFTLAWTHSVQKTEWEEDWRIDGGRLTIVEARVEGSGAGMDPPPEARFDSRFWRWKPKVPPLKTVVLRRSGATADWRLCVNGRCEPMSKVLPPDIDPVVLSPCKETPRP